MKPWRSAAVVTALICAGVLTGCSSQQTSTSTEADDETSTAVALSDVTIASSGAEVLSALAASHDDASDYAWSASDEQTITLSGSSASSSSNDVEITGDTITITAAGTYRISGTFSGQIVVDAPGDDIVRLVLDGASISSTSSAAIAIMQAHKTLIYTEAGTTNSVSDASSYATDAEINAAIWSSDDLTIGGEGTLTVTGNGNDGIASKDGLVISGGTLNVTAKDDGVRGKDYTVISGGTLSISSGGDGVKATNTTDTGKGYIAVTGGTLTVTAGGDGLSAASYLVATGGSGTITTGGGAASGKNDSISQKGLKAGQMIVADGEQFSINSADDAVHSKALAHLASGTLTVATADDALHATTSILISGGSFTATEAYEGIEGKTIEISGGTNSVTTSDDGINGTEGTVAGGDMNNESDVMVTISGGTTTVDAGGDGLDSNGSAQMSGGSLTISGSTANDNAAIDFNGTFLISGGTLVATGMSGMAQSPGADSSQTFVAITLSKTYAAGSTIELTDSSGNVVTTVTLLKAANSLVYSSSGLTAGASYSAGGGTATAGTAFTESMGGGPGGPGGGPNR